MGMGGRADEGGQHRLARHTLLRADGRAGGGHTMDVAFRSSSFACGLPSKAPTGMESGIRAMAPGSSARIAGTAFAVACLNPGRSQATSSKSTRAADNAQRAASQ